MHPAGREGGGGGGCTSIRGEGRQTRSKAEWIRNGSARCRLREPPRRGNARNAARLEPAAYREAEKKGD